MAISYRPLTSSFGLEIANLDLIQPWDEDVAADLRAAWVEGGIIVVHADGIDEERHIRFSEIFDELEPSATRGLNDRHNAYLLPIEAARPTGCRRAIPL